MQKNKRIVLAIVFFATALVAIFLLYIFSDTISNRSNADSMHATVMVCTDNGYGHGMVYVKNRDEIVIVTAAHVIDDDNVSVRFADYEEAKANMVWVDADKDIAFIKITANSVKPQILHRINTVDIMREVTNDNAEIPFKCYDLSLHNGRAIEIEGTVEALDEFIYEYDRPMILAHTSYVDSNGNAGMPEGLSGAPMFDYKGKLIGMVDAGNDKGDVIGVTGADIDNSYKQYKEQIQ